MLVASVIAVVSGSVGYYFGQRPSESTQKVEEEKQIKEPPIAPPVPIFISKKTYLTSPKLDDVVFKKDLLEEIMSIKLRKTVIDDVHKTDLLGEIKSVQLKKRPIEEDKKTNYTSENVFLKQLNEKRQSLRRVNIGKRLTYDSEDNTEDNQLFEHDSDDNQIFEHDSDDNTEGNQNFEHDSDDNTEDLEYEQTISEYVFLNE